MEFTLDDIQPKEKCRFKFEFEPKYEIGELITGYTGSDPEYGEHLTLKITGYKLEVTEGFGGGEITICYYAKKIGEALSTPDAEYCVSFDSDDNYYVIDFDLYNWDGGKFYIQKDNENWKEI